MVERLRFRWLMEGLKIVSVKPDGVAWKTAGGASGCSSCGSVVFCSAFSRGVPGQQTLDNCLICQIRVVCCLHEPGQIAVWIQAVLNGRLDQAEDHCAAGRASYYVGKRQT